MSDRLKESTEGLQRRHVRPETGYLTLEETKQAAGSQGWKLKSGDEALIQSGDLHIIQMMISDKTVDRHNDSINANGWELKNYNGSILWAHNHNLPVIGKALNTWVGGDKLRQIWKSVPKDIDGGFSDMIGKMYKHEYLTDSSVGFKILEYEVSEERTDENSWFPALNITKQELLENSAVNVGAHPGAGAKAFEAAKAAGIDTTPMAVMAAKLLDMTALSCGISREDLEKAYFANREENKSLFTVESTFGVEEKDEDPEIEKSGPSITDVNLAVIRAVEIKKAELELRNVKTRNRK